jgi:hypothetical protein
MQLCILYIFANLKLPPISYSGCETSFNLPPQSECKTSHYLRRYTSKWVRHSITCLEESETSNNLPNEIPITCLKESETSHSLPLHTSKWMRHSINCLKVSETSHSLHNLTPHTSVREIPQCMHDMWSRTSWSKWMRHQDLYPNPATSYLKLNEYSHYLWPHTSKWVRHSITYYLTCISQWVWDIPLPATSYLSEWDHNLPPRTSVSVRHQIIWHLIPQCEWDVP